MLKIVSENFIHALLLFLGLFLKISRWVPLLIPSQFDYCNIVWGNCGKTLFDRLQKLQNRAARVLTFSRYDAETNRLLRQLNWKDLGTQFQIQNLKCKSLNDLVPGYLSPKFVKRYETRYSLSDSAKKLIVPFPRTNFLKNTFSYSGAVLWNSLPCDMREGKSFSQLNDWLTWISEVTCTVYTAFMKNRSWLG